MSVNARDIIHEICSLLFPLLRLKSANKIIDHKIRLFENEETAAFSYMIGYEQLTNEEAEKYLTKTFEARKNLEDKAKTNVFGVTISVSLIVGFSQLFTNSNFYANAVVTITVSILIIYSLMSVVLGTILSLLILGKYNRIYDMYPTNKSDTTDEQLKNIAINSELNSLYNIKRNNLLYSSYGLIINFLISVSLAFIIVILFLRKPNDSDCINRINNIQSEMRGGLMLFSDQLKLQENENAKISNDLKTLKKELISNNTKKTARNKK